MALEVINMAKTYLTPDVLSQLGRMLGESAATTERTLGSAVPALLGGLLNKVSAPGGAQSLLSIVQQGGFGSDFLSGFQNLLTGSAQSDKLLTMGKGLLDSVFGSQRGAVTETVASASGVSGGSASSALAMAAPLVMGLIGKEVTTNGLTASGLSSWLNSQKESIARFAPPGLAGALGLNSMSDLGGTATRAVRTVTEETQRAGNKLLPWLLLAGAVVLGFLLYRSCAPAASTLSRITLPGGQTIELLQNSFNANLAKYLANPADMEVPKRLVFDNLNYDSGTTRITLESQPTVAALATILKAYPSAEIRLEGHTDNTGDAGANKKLSLDRAEAVKEMLVLGGVDGARISTEGFGSDRPVADNDSADGRARNRRTECVVTKK